MDGNNPKLSGLLNSSFGKKSEFEFGIDVVSVRGGISLPDPVISLEVMNKKTPEVTRIKHKQQIMINNDTKIITTNFLLFKNSPLILIIHPIISCSGGEFQDM
jgi:hypothetical protein